MSEQRFFPSWGPRTEELARYMDQTYNEEGYEVQLLKLEGTQGGWLLQIRDRYDGDWQKKISSLTGLDTAATVTFKVEGDGVAVSIGGGKWLDKAAVGGVAMLFSAGLLLVPAGVGAWKQGRLLKDVTRNLETYVRVRSHGTSSEESKQDTETNEDT